ncbi:hypothetical protein DOY81_002466 [Sarcophaga bullata]|nr:hypothetical protein DOY81_002466 [Sarcophaga bullata]
MMLEEKKIKLLLFLLLAWIATSSADDTETLRTFSVAIQNALHDANISLDNEGNLIFKGLIVQKLKIPHDPDNILRINLEYVADKNGYKSKYVLIKEEFIEIKKLTPAALKSIAG